MLSLGNNTAATSPCAPSLADTLLGVFSHRDVLCCSFECFLPFFALLLSSVADDGWLTLDYFNGTIVPDSALNTTYDGKYALFTRAIDDAGNIGPTHQLDYWIDTTPPPPPSSLSLLSTDTQKVLLNTRTADFLMTLVGDESPGLTVFYYSVAVNANPPVCGFCFLR